MPIVVAFEDRERSDDCTDAPPTDVRVRLLQALRRTSGSMWSQLVLFAFVGAMFNLAYGGLYVLLRTPLGPQVANVIALVATTVADTAVNRRFTFGVHGRHRVVRHQFLGLMLLVLGLAVTAGSLWVLQLTTSAPSRISELAVLAGANLFVGVVRFVAFRLWMRPGGEAIGPPGGGR